MAQLSRPYMTTGKTMGLTRQTFDSKVMSLLFKRLSGLVIAFPPKSNRLLISWLQSLSTVTLEPKKIKSVSRSLNKTKLVTYVVCSLSWHHELRRSTPVFSLKSDGWRSLAPVCSLRMSCRAREGPSVILWAASCLQESQRNKHNNAFARLHGSGHILFLSRKQEFPSFYSACTPYPALISLSALAREGSGMVPASQVLSGRTLWTLTQVPVGWLGAHTGTLEPGQGLGSWKEDWDGITEGAKVGAGAFERLVKLAHGRLWVSGQGGWQLLKELSRTLSYIRARQDRVLK